MSVHVHSIHIYIYIHIHIHDVMCMYIMGDMVISNGEPQDAMAERGSLWGHCSICKVVPCRKTDMCSWVANTFE